MTETFPATVDYTALTEPITVAEVKAFRRAARASSTGMRTVRTIATVGVAVVIGCLVLAIAVAGFSEGSPPVTAGLLALGLAAVAVACVAVVLASRARWGAWMRLDRFARANRFAFSSRSEAPAYPGSIFSQGSDRAIRDRITSTTGHTFDLGTLDYVTGSGKSREEHHWGYLAVRLDRPLPHMVLDAKSNNGFFGTTNLPEGFSRAQRLSLEGDFDRYFTLYCPKEYERDALYVFTPDLMVLLIDEAQNFDVEIVDDWMFVYAATPLRLVEPAVARRMFRILATVGAKATDRATRYSDDHAGALPGRTIAPAGRRLRTSFPVIGAVFAVLLIGYGIASAIFNW
ncbi:DUF3137 domain-containing protein [Leifsonia poae]|uniref:DUF3137 domain-containing protein n=1 Tax=Leifsonia poae TaxID=110933 RepID=UPI001CC1A4FA|nr:DUF3137 domain-containing protein [Leifsonia poae]